MIVYTFGELPVLWRLAEVLVDEIFAFIMHPYARMVLKRIAELNQTLPPEQRYVLAHKVMEMSKEPVLHKFDGATNYFIQLSMQDVEHIARMVTMMPLMYSFPHKRARKSCSAKHQWEVVFYYRNQLFEGFSGPTKREFAKLIRPFQKEAFRQIKNRTYNREENSVFPALTKGHRGMIIQSYEIRDLRYKFFDFHYEYLSREQAVLAFLVMGIPYTWNGQDRQGFWFHTKNRQHIKHAEVMKFVEANRQLLV